MDKRQIVIYTAGPYSGDIARNVKVAAEYAAAIWDMGFTVLCPQKNSEGFERVTDCVW